MMNNIKSNHIIKISVVCIILFISTSYTNMYLDNTYDFGGFKNKSYFTALFNNSEIIELTDAENIYNKGKSVMFKAENSFRKADGYYKINENYGGKTKKKALRHEKKAVKYALKAYNYYFQATDKTFRIYSSSLNKIDNDNSKRHLKAEELSIDARSLFLASLEIIQKSNNLNGKAKLDAYKKAYGKQIKALEQQEIAFMIFMNDPEVKYDKKHDKIIVNDDNSNTDEDKTENEYQPDKDPNVYISKEESIIENLIISESDMMSLDDARDKRGYADILMEEVDKDYTKIENIRNEAELIEDEYERNLKNKMAAGLEKVLFDKMIKAADLYFQADKVKYEIYLKYLPAARESESFDQGQLFEENAAKLHSKALKDYNKTHFYSENKSNKYIQLMNAVQTELSAIQEQENAFSVYFKFDVTPLEEIIVDENNQQGKTNDNKSNNRTKLTYNYLGSYIYSLQNPDPQPITHKKGIIFKVQIGLFKNLLPLNNYAKFSPISYDTFKNNPYKRFMLGEYRSYKSAEYVLNYLKEKGMTDPFILSYENGVRKSAVYGLSKIIRNEEFETVEAEELSYLKGDITESSEEFDYSKIIETSAVKGLAYYVQLGNFSFPKKKTDFKDIQKLYTDKTGSLHKYLSGIFSNYSEAKKEAEKLQKTGYSEAFVSAYNDGSKISLSDAEKLITSGENNIQPDKTEIYFSVQIGVYSHKLTKEELDKFKPVPDKYKIHSKEKGGGLYIYYVGQYKTYTEAENVKKDIKNMGQDGFIIAFKNNKKISAKEAIEQLKNN